MLSLILAAQRLGKNVMPVMEKYVEFEQLMASRNAKAQADARRAHPAGDQRRGQVGGLRWRPLEVRHLAAGAGASRRAPRARGQPRVLRAAALPSRQPDLRHPGAQARRPRKSRRSTPSWSARGVPIRYLDVGGGLGVNYDGQASRTAASTTACRNTPTRSSSRSRKSATSARSRTRSWFPRAAGR